MVMSMITPEAGAAFMADWFARQKEMFESLVPKVKRPEADPPTAKPATKPDDAMRSYMDFWSSFARAMPAQAGALDGAALETLVDASAKGRSAMSPPEFRNGFGKGPSFATLWDWDQKSFKAYGAWLELQQAVAAQQSIIDAAWADASRRFQEAVSKPVDDDHPPITSWRGGLDLWLATANQALLEMQRGTNYLDAQRKLLAASMEYRLKLREIAEDLCELYQVPGRTEIDELARMVHDLRREVRELKRKQRTAGAAR